MRRPTYQGYIILEWGSRYTGEFKTRDEALLAAAQAIAAHPDWGKVIEYGTCKYPRMTDRDGL